MKVYSVIFCFFTILFFEQATLAQKAITSEEIIVKGEQPTNSEQPRFAKSHGSDRRANGNKLSSESIIPMLQGDSPTLTESERRTLDEIKKREETRTFTLKDREDAEKFSAPREKVLVEVQFDYNSANIQDQAKPMLDQLGIALQDPRLAGKTFLFTGHTDARGDPNYNLHLSDQRAAAVKNYIVSHFKVNERDITLIGEGSRVPKNPQNPYADENRRVEVVRAN